MAPSDAAPAQHHPRSSSEAADVAVALMVAMPPPPSSAANYHHHHHHRRAGAPLSATSMVSLGTGTRIGTGIGMQPMDVVRHRRTSSTSTSLSSALPAPLQQGEDERKVQLLSRSLSGSRLNAGAPTFIPRGLQIACSTSLPEDGQGLGFSPPALVQALSSVIPVIIPPPLVPAQAPRTGVFVPLAEEDFLESPLSVDKVSLKDKTDGPEVLLASNHVEEGEQAQGPAVKMAQAAKPVVIEELKAKIVKQVEFYFSNTNLPTDNYLMKSVKKDPKGFHMWIQPPRCAMSG